MMSNIKYVWVVSAGDSGEVISVEKVYSERPYDKDIMDGRMCHFGPWKKIKDDKNGAEWISGCDVVSLKKFKVS